MITHNDLPPDLPEFGISQETGATRGDLRRWLEATEGLIPDDTPVFLSRDSEGNGYGVLWSLDVSAYRADHEALDGRMHSVHPVHPDDIDPDDPDDVALPVAIVLWP